MAYADYLRWKTTPLTDTPTLSIVIPAYNEAIRIVPTIGAMASHVSGMGFEWELIIADDGSKDETVALVEGLGLVNAKVLRAPANGGKGSAVQRGMLAASGRYQLFADADNSTPIEEVTKLIAQLQSGYDVAIGSRAAQGAEEAHRSPLRRLMSGGLRWIVRHVLRIGVLDTQCGFKLFTRDAAHLLYGRQTIMGFSFDLEILYLAFKYKLRVAEVPVSWIDAPGSKVDALKEARRFIKDLARIKWNDLRGVYPRHVAQAGPAEETTPAPQAAQADPAEASAQPSQPTRTVAGLLRGYWGRVQQVFTSQPKTAPAANATHTSPEAEIHA